MGAERGSETRGSASRAPLESGWIRRLRRVLLLDDRAWDRDAVAEAARAAGLLPRTASNPDRAAAFLEQPTLSVEAVLLPLSQLRGGGARILDRIWSCRPALPVFVHATRGEDAELERSRPPAGPGGVRVIGPVTPDEFAREVARQLQRGSRG